MINVDFIKKFKNDESSIFTKAFVEDCILIFAEMKKKPKMNKKKGFSIVMKSQGPLSGSN